MPRMMQDFITKYEINGESQTMPQVNEYFNTPETMTQAPS